MGTRSGLVASLGLHVRTGRALAIGLAGPFVAPAILFRRELSLWEERLGSKGPYHTTLDLPWAEAMLAARPVAAEVEAIAAGCMRRLLAELSEAGYRACGVGVVGSMGQDPARIGNPHIRAHAAEGQLFRRAVELAAEDCGLRYHSCSPEDAAAPADATLVARAQGLGKGLIHPWRVDERSATVAALIILSA